MAVTPQAFLKALEGRSVRLQFTRAESTAAEGILAGFDSLGVVLRRGGRETLFPWAQVRSVEAARPD